MLKFLWVHNHHTILYCLVLPYTYLCCHPPPPPGRVLGRVWDIESLLALVRSSKEEGESTRIYGYLYEFLRKNLLKPKLPPLVGDGLTPPPFEKPCIAQVRAHTCTYDICVVCYNHIHYYSSVSCDLHTGTTVPCGTMHKD